MYPLRRFDDRTLPEDFTGTVITCDVDKTYLDTDFESLPGLLTIPLEWAEDKKTIAGMAPVLRALRFGIGEHNRQVPFYFLTASPPAMRKQLSRKMLLDQVQHDGITCKDWNRILVKRKKPGWLGRQVAYKLCALLHQRTFFPAGAKEILIGDDAETDAVAYALYADLAAGRIEPEELEGILKKEKCDADEVREVFQALDSLSHKAEAVERIYIYLVKGRDPSMFRRFGDGLIPCKSPFQLALHLAIHGFVLADGVEKSARDLVQRGKADTKKLAVELEDGVKRLLFTVKELRPFLARLADQGLLEPGLSLPQPDPDQAPISRASRGGRWYAAG